MLAHAMTVILTVAMDCATEIDSVSVTTATTLLDSRVGSEVEAGATLKMEWPKGVNF